MNRKHWAIAARLVASLVTLIVPLIGGHRHSELKIATASGLKMEYRSTTR